MKWKLSLSVSVQRNVFFFFPVSLLQKQTLYSLGYCFNKMLRREGEDLKSRLGEQRDLRIVAASEGRGVTS